MNTPTVIRVSKSVELLGMIPHLIGNQPSNSVVLIPFEGSRAQSAFRIDLPQLDTPMDDFTNAMIGLLCRVEGCTGAALVVYTDGHLDAATSDWSGLAEDVENACAHAGLTLMDALVVAEDGWADFTTPGEIHTHVPEPAALPGIPLPPRVQDSAALPEVPITVREQVVEALNHRDPMGQQLDRIDLGATLEKALTAAGELSAAELADIALLLTTPATRDVALLQWSGSPADGEAVLAYQRDYRAGLDPASHESMVRFVGQGDRPDFARLQAALDVSRRVASAAGEPFRSGPLTACAWLCWALGRTTDAVAYLRQVNPFSPSARFAELLGAMIEAGRLPEWLFTRP